MPATRGLQAQMQATRGTMKDTDTSACGLKSLKRCRQHAGTYVATRGCWLCVTLARRRSACTYVGAEALKHLSKRTTFIRVTQQLNNVFGPPS